MIPSSSKDPIERALQELPRQVASDDFTRQVLQRVESRRQTGPPVRRWAVATATVALVVLAVALGLKGRQRDGSARDLTAKAEQLRQEHQLLRDELADLKRFVDENPSMIYLGGDENVDLVFDLAPVVSLPDETGPRPAVLRDSDRNRIRSKE